MASSKKSGPGAAAPPAKTGVAALDDIFKPYNVSDAPGLVVGVSQHGRVLYRKGFGLASIEHAVANTPATRMRIASTTKHFACLAALLLAEQGQLDLDAPATLYLPELPTPRGVPTLRQMMTHTSGVRCYVDLLLIAAGLSVHRPGNMLSLQARQTDANFAPGEGQLYSNGGYNLLSEAIARAAGMPFEQFLKDRILTPLGMHDSAVIPSDLSIVPGMATLHMPVPPAQGGGLRRGLMMSEESRGDGGIVSSVDDMLAWMAHLRAALKGQPRIGSADSWRQLVQPARLNNGLPSIYALGLIVDQYRDLDVLHHAGGAAGGACQMITVPGHELDIIVITNTLMVPAESLAHQVIDCLLAEYVKGQPAKLPSAKRFRHLHGAQYHSPRTGVRFGFEPVGEQLGIAMFNLPAGPLLIDDGDSLRMGFERVVMGPFVWQLSDLKAAPEGSAPARLPVTDGGVPDVLELLPAVPPDTARAGRALLGRHHCADLGATATIAFKGKDLTLHLVGDYGVHTMTVEALSPTVFTAKPLDRTLPFGYGITLRRKGRQVTGFDLGSGRTRQLRFVRQPD
jgi:CubicO group peptidase (beta-lactamase class C family)